MMVMVTQEITQMKNDIEETNYDDDDAVEVTPPPQPISKPVITSNGSITNITSDVHSSVNGSTTYPSTFTSINPVSTTEMKFVAPNLVPNLQGLEHDASLGAIMSTPIEKKGRLTSVERLLDGENLRNVIKAIFQNAEIMSCEVKRGAKSSANIYVHKKYTGKKSTVIIWDD